MERLLISWRFSLLLAWNFSRWEVDRSANFPDEEDGSCRLLKGTSSGVMVSGKFSVVVVLSDGVFVSFCDVGPSCLHGKVGITLL